MNFDAFSSSQMLSKLWLAQHLEYAVDEDFPTERNGYRVWILGGWYGLTNLILRTRSKMKILEVRSFDIDPECEVIADKINELWVWQAWQFKAVTQDVNTLEYSPKPQIVINTSVEHMDSDEWYRRIPEGTLVALQASNLPHEDHKNIFNSARDLMNHYPFDEIYFEGTKRFQYDDNGFYRYMVIGKK